MARLVAALAVASTVLGACASVPRVTPPLQPDENAPVWPNAPEPARYAYAGTLIGEGDFLAGDDVPRTAGQELIEFITGLAFGEQAPMELQRPVAGMVDGEGRVLVADVGQRAVMVFDMPNQRFLRWSMATPDEPFSAPVALTGDGSGGFLVTDSERGHVYRLDHDGAPVEVWGAGVLRRPTGIARNPATGAVLVTDTELHQVLVFSPRGELLDTIGARGTRPGFFNFPTYLAVADGLVYVADSLNFRVQAFSMDGDNRLAFGHTGIRVGDMARPKGVAIGGDGRIYVVESYYDHLLVFDRQGRLLLAVGGTGNDEGRFYLPAGVWTDDAGRVYVADMFNGRVSVFQELTVGPEQ